MWKIFTGLLSGVAVIALLHMISIQEGHNRLCAIEEGSSIFHVDHRARPLRYNIMSDRGMDRIKSYPITDRSFRGKFATFLRDEIQFPPVLMSPNSASTRSTPLSAPERIAPLAHAAEMSTAVFAFMMSMYCSLFNCQLSVWMSSKICPSVI